MPDVLLTSEYLLNPNAAAGAAEHKKMCALILAEMKKPSFKKLAGAGNKEINRQLVVRPQAQLQFNSGMNSLD